MHLFSFLISAEDFSSGGTFSLIHFLRFCLNFLRFVSLLMLVGREFHDLVDLQRKPSLVGSLDICSLFTMLLASAALVL